MTHNGVITIIGDGNVIGDGNTVNLTLYQHTRPPAVDAVTLAANPLFVGCECDLRHRAHAPKGNANGLGDIGKTELAGEFAHRYGPYFAGGIFWLSFADPQAIPAEIAMCGDACLCSTTVNWCDIR